MNETRIDIVCTECGSNDVILSAGVRWDTETQEYEVMNVHDRSHYCADCGNDCDIKEMPITY